MARLFITKSLFFSIIFLLSAPLSAEQSSPKVVVVGAGFSGLTAAYRLQQKGFDVDVYEARGRVGGRVFSVDVAGHIAELGGQNIKDGGDCKNILALTKELGLEMKEGTKRFHLNYCENNRAVDIAMLLQARKYTPENLMPLLEATAAKSKNMQEVLGALFFANDPLYKYCNALLVSYEGAPIEKLSPLSIQTLYHILLGGLSSSHQASEEKCISYLWIKGGNGLIAEKLSERLSKPVHLKHALKAISKNPAGSYILTFQNGRKVSADIIVLTIPCPVFADIEIDPTVMPSDKKAQIASLQYGTCTKILTPVLPDEKAGQYANGRMVSFYDNEGHTLCMYYTGSSSKFIASTIQETYQKDLTLVKQYYSVQSQSVPVMAKDQAFASYFGPVGHSFPNDPFAKGSYSCIGAGQEALFTSLSDVKGEPTKTLFAPINNTLFFAGEHTTTLLDVGGTMEAAVESGERIARTIASSCKQ